MNKSIVILSVLLVGAIAMAVVFAMQTHHERERANALAVRAFEREPIEKGGPPSSSFEEPRHPPRETIVPPPHIESTGEQSVLADAPVPQKSVLDFSGSLRARQEVARLQTRLANGTPLQDYQIRALIEAFDGLYMTPQRSAQTPDDQQAYVNEQKIQLASDILFESQMEVFVEMLRRR